MYLGLLAQTHHPPSLKTGYFYLNVNQIVLESSDMLRDKYIHMRIQGNRVDLL